MFPEAFCLDYPDLGDASRHGPIRRPTPKVRTTVRNAARGGASWRRVELARLWGTESRGWAQDTCFGVLALHGVVRRSADVYIVAVVNITPSEPCRAKEEYPDENGERDSHERSRVILSTETSLPYRRDMGHWSRDCWTAASGCTTHLPAGGHPGGCFASSLRDANGYKDHHRSRGCPRRAGR